MINEEASSACRDVLSASYNGVTPGFTYYVLRDGKPFVDASFGQARRGDAADGALSYSANTIVHLASVSKFICAVAVLRLIEDWNEIFARLRPRLRTGAFRYVGPARPNDVELIKSVQKYHVALSLDTRVYDLMKAYLDHVSIANDASGYPGDGITEITLRELLTHRSGLRGALRTDKLGLTMDQIVRENEPGGKAFFDLARDVSSIFAQNITDKSESYSNEGYDALGAFVQFLTATPFEAWCRKKIFPEKSFDDIARRPVDMARAARYYEPGPNGTFTYGNHHPDYADFGACGGWYASAAALCRWVHAVMKGRKFGGTAIRTPIKPLSVGVPKTALSPSLLLRLGRPILREPRQLFDLGLGFDGGNLDFGYMHGKAKNGGTGTPGGSTNCRFVYLEGYGDYSIVAFAQANCSLDANPLLELGLRPLREWLYDPTPLPEGPVATPLMVDGEGLHRTAFWEDGGTQQTAQQSVQFAIKTVSISGVSAQRTDLLGTIPYAAGRSLNSTGFLKLTGVLRSTEAGTYSFRLSSDDGALLWLDHILVIDNDARQTLSSSVGQLALPANGILPIMVYWYNVAYSGALYLEWQRPGSPGFEPVPVDNLRLGWLNIRPLDDGPLPLPL